jgi:hypothetical protein
MVTLYGTLWPTSINIHLKFLLYLNYFYLSNSWYCRWCFPFYYWKSVHLVDLVCSLIKWDLNNSGSFAINQVWKVGTKWSHVALKSRTHLSNCLVSSESMNPFTFVHTNREANNYVNIFEGLKKLNSEFKDIRAFGSDGNLALLNAVAICYPSPLQVCTKDSHII